MAELGLRVKELLKETKTYQPDQLTGYNDEGVRKVIQECTEHNDLMARVVADVQEQHQTAGDAGEEEADNPAARIDWQQHPDHAAALLVHHACICHNKRGLLAYCNERAKQLKYVWWQRRTLPDSLKERLSPKEVEFFKAYDGVMRGYGNLLGGTTAVDMDLTTDVTPPSDPCVRVTCPEDVGEYTLSVGKVNLKKDSVHRLPLSDAEPLMREGKLVAFNERQHGM